MATFRDQFHTWNSALRLGNGEAPTTTERVAGWRRSWVDTHELLTECRLSPKQWDRCLSWETRLSHIIADWERRLKLEPTGPAPTITPQYGWSMSLDLWLLRRYVTRLHRTKH